MRERETRYLRATLAPRTGTTRQQHQNDEAPPTIVCRGGACDYAECARRDSNPRPLAPEASLIPPHYRHHAGLSWAASVMRRRTPSSHAGICRVQLAPQLAPHNHRPYTLRSKRYKCYACYAPGSQVSGVIPSPHSRRVPRARESGARRPQPAGRSVGGGRPLRTPDFLSPRHPTS